MTEELSDRVDEEGTKFVRRWLHSGVVTNPDVPTIIRLRRVIDGIEFYTLIWGTFPEKEAPDQGQVLSPNTLPLRGAPVKIVYTNGRHSNGYEKDQTRGWKYQIMEDSSLRSTVFGEEAAMDAMRDLARRYPFNKI
ncbi:hypothetical protein J4442_05785 [Candidatus Woesearchaeota archaeon]|nr:hypothetical protein [Candidatus Woesearchaeota archaeon]